jgi:hypothetical protein
MFAIPSLTPTVSVHDSSIVGTDDPSFRRRLLYVKVSTSFAAIPSRC